MKKFLLFLLLPVIFFTITGASVFSDNKGWTIYENKEFSILYPPDWKIDTTEAMWGNMSISPPGVDDKKSTEGVMLLYGKIAPLRWATNDSGVTIVDTSGNGIIYTLDSEVAGIEKMIKDTFNMPGVNMIVNHMEESVRKSINGVEYQSITTTSESTTHDATTHELTLRKSKDKQYIFVKDNRYYFIDFRASQRRYEELIKTADIILNSFHLK